MSDTLTYEMHKLLSPAYNAWLDTCNYPHSYDAFVAGAVWACQAQRKADFKVADLVFVDIDDFPLIVQNQETP